MPKKLLTSALILSLSVFLTACTLRDLPVIGKFFPGGGSSSFPTGPVKLSVWGLWESPEAMDVLIKKYQEVHPNVTIEYDDRSVIKPEDYKASVYNRVSQEGAADIVIVHNSWVPGIKDSLSTAPAEVATAENYGQKFYPSATQSAVLDGKVYALPMYYDGLVLVYNKKHFEEIDQDTPPVAWEEFRKLALDLTITGGSQGITRAGAAIGTANNVDFFMDIIGLMFAQAKISVPEGLDTKAAEDAVSFYANFVLEDKVWNAEMPEAASAFAQEKVSMILVPSWQILDILRARPDLDIGVAPVPQALPEDPASWASFWMSTVPSVSKNQVVAWDFLNFMSQDPQQLMLFNEASKYREFGSPYSVMSLKGELASNKYLSPLLDTAEFSKTGLLTARSGNKGVHDEMKKVVELALQRGDISGALAAAKQVMLQAR